jgi:hypothetical protein
MILQHFFHHSHTFTAFGAASAGGIHVLRILGWIRGDGLPEAVVGKCVADADIHGRFPRWIRRNATAIYSQQDFYA